MKATQRAVRHRKRGSLLMMGAPVAVIAVALVAYLLMGSFSDRKVDAGHVAAAATTAAPSSVPATLPSSPATPADPSPARPSATPRTHTANPTAAPQQAASAGTAPLAGRIQPGVSYHGVATSYAAGDGDGACLYGPSSDLMIAAMNATDYESSKACGAYVLVHAGNGASITVRITNECPPPCAPGQLDLSQQAFAALANPSLGRIPITWQLLSPSSVGTISLRYKTGSSRYWCGIQVIGHRNPVALLEVRNSAGGWRQLPRTDYNYFLSADGTGCGGPIRITDIYGQQLTADGIALTPGAIQPTGLQFTRH
jgi:expansin (peptidoglycan-binding protein)